MFAKVLLSAVVIGIMAILFLNWEWKPATDQIASLDQQITQKNAEYQKDQEFAKNLTAWENARQAFEDVLAKLHQTASPKTLIPSFLTDIEKLVKNERLSAGDPDFRVNSITPGAVPQETPPSSGTEKKTEGKPAAPPAQPLQAPTGSTIIQLNFTGRFNTIVDFLQQLGNFKLNKLVTIQSISLTPQSPKVGLSPTLGVTMPFKVYVLGGG